MLILVLSTPKPMQLSQEDMMEIKSSIHIVKK